MQSLGKREANICSTDPNFALWFACSTETLNLSPRRHLKKNLNS